VRIADQKLLKEFATLQLEITQARNPTAALDCSPAVVHRTVGYKKLRAFFLHLSPAKRERYRKQLRREIDGIRQVIAMAKANGEELSLADITIEVFDDKGDVVKAPEIAAADESEPAQ
jgi:hypothetical protein